MKAAIFVVAALYPDYWRSAISGHVQTSLKTAEILVKRGHEVTFITTSAAPGWQLPLANSISSQVRIITVDVPTVAGVEQVPRMSVAFGFVRELRRLVLADDFALVHFFGGDLTAYLAGAMKLAKVKACSVMTMVQYSKPDHLLYRAFERMLLPRIDAVVALSNWTKRCLTERGIRDVHMTRPGVLAHQSSGQTRMVRVRPHSTGLVLFWRDASYMNGVDVCMDAFKSLSVEFPKVDFVFAVRPGRPFDDELRTLDIQHGNIHTLFFPYKDGITILDLVNSASCVVLPFRSLACDPQMAVLETILAGTFLITTPVGSNRELLEGIEGPCLVEPGNVQETYSAIKYALNNNQEVKEVARAARSRALRDWNWNAYEKALMEAYAAGLARCGDSYEEL